jgi:hypothetical protein
MKRSEAIKKLMRFSGCVHEVIHHDGHMVGGMKYWKAERLLDFIEKELGMLPPVRIPEPDDESVILSVDYNHVWNEE